MALSGALEDMEIVDLLQFPSSGQRSGELIINDGRQRAKFYYVRGRLVHASLGNLKGPPVLVKVVGWRTGEFVFHGEVASPETSIEMDVHHAVLNAVRLRDEEVEAAQHLPRDLGPAPTNNEDPAAQLLAAFIAANPWAQVVAVLSARGEVRTSAAQPGGAELASGPLSQLMATWPRAGLRRCIVEDEAGTIVAVPIQSGEVLMLAATKSVATGMVSVAVGKIAASWGACGQ